MAKFNVGDMVIHTLTGSIQIIEEIDHSFSNNGGFYFYWFKDHYLKFKSSICETELIGVKDEQHLYHGSYFSEE